MDEVMPHAFATVTSKLAQSYEALKTIEALDVGNTPKKMVWKKDNVALYHYECDSPALLKTPVLLVYAQVNRHDMLDIQADRSFIRNLQSAGLDLYLIDWGYPSKEDRFNTMEEYICGYLNDAVDFVRHESNQKSISMMGVCQGGTFSVIYSALHIGKIKNLITLVTPIDFHTKDDMLSLWARHLDVDSLVDSYGNISGQLLNTGFEMLKPLLKTSKYINMLSAVDKQAQLLNFLRMEKWIADSPSQPGECFRKFMKDLYQQNKLVKGTLKIGARIVNLSEITVPLLNIYAEQDHLVPPDASIPLNELVGSKDKCLTRFEGGHIGVFVGSRSQKELAPGIVSWLKQRDTDV
ncbi:class III poly(R)-hydroxyalkanoic acid synthase subunit PhaC [Dyadobacter sp. CY323]|uniref:class III poly(R)-hydroxyalkanoic acid synthase subunit PhaC n=1 Tax=Dyadobacter sp. CY323 TaxID=2907302 RepID=UPI001F27F2E1|nr:class III poly(R)-hydroxyalkanoic acid synthase subunit PhaC [Dyadobacter sp. CY323]MCE6991282.1 class III poly(R)-hydroxyalkanoic acid synthase subunit PhaC [Dyadobacter sp. CY323]